MPQEHGPRVHPDNPKWEYIFIRQLNSGEISVLQPDGSVGGVVPNQHILATLNDFGREGWDVVQGGPNPDSSGINYLLKRRV
jgi:hypothetical protein